MLLSARRLARSLHLVPSSHPAGAHLAAPFAIGHARIPSAGTRRIASAENNDPERGSGDERYFVSLGRVRSSASWEEDEGRSELDLARSSAPFAQLAADDHHQRERTH